MTLNLSEILLSELADDSIEKILLNEESYAEEEIKQLMVNEDIFLVRPKRTAANPGFCEQVVPNYSEREFIKEFRIGKDVFQDLIQQFSQSEIYQGLLRGYGLTPTTAEKHFMVFLYYVGDETASFREVANRFDLCLQTMHAIITRVCLFLSSLSSQAIKWPDGQRMSEIKAHYRQNMNMPEVVGILDATHILIDKPYKDHTDYINSHNKHSIILQGVCDHEHKFIDIFVGYQGSVSDARVFVNSPLFDKLPDLCDDGAVVADDAYPCLANCVVPYNPSAPHLSTIQRYFNHVLTTCHSDIRLTFTLLKQRFRRLYHLKLRGHTRMNHLVRACCVLHNLASKADVRYFAPPKEEEEVVSESDLDDVPLTGRGRRDRIAREVFDKR